MLWGIVRRLNGWWCLWCCTVDNLVLLSRSIILTANSKFKKEHECALGYCRCNWIAWPCWPANHRGPGQWLLIRRGSDQTRWCHDWGIFRRTTHTIHVQQFVRGANNVHLNLHSLFRRWRALKGSRTLPCTAKTILCVKLWTMWKL